MSAGGRAGCELLVIISEERADEDKDNRIVAERLIPAKAKK
jgi:hypothetical protein